MVRYAITDGATWGGNEAGREAALLEQAERLAAAGVDFLQLRERGMEPGKLAALARRVRETIGAHRSRTKLLINSRADVAVAARADGVHIPSAPGSLTPDEVRRVYRLAGLAEPVVSVSCHTLAEVTAARTAGVSAILFGPVFEKVVSGRVAGGAEAMPTRVAEGTGLNLLHLACSAAAPTAVLALGGITKENTAACLAAGAAGIAAIRLFSLAGT